MEQNQTIDVYDIITNRIIELLEQGTVPWQKPWNDAGLPKNMISGNSYRGINIFMLASLGYEQNLFLTFKQIKDIGGSVKKGEKGHFVVFWKQLQKEITEEQKDQLQKKINILRYYKVFNIFQCTDIPPNLIPIVEIRENDLITPLKNCELIIDNMPNCPRIEFKGQKAYYDVVNDFINMPKLKKFKVSEGYYSTLFHELIHSTGHESRLNRKELIAKTSFGEKEYSIEELTAEIGSCYLQSYTNIAKDNFVNSAAYINGWLEKLKNDKRFIFYASSRAQHAVDYILNVKLETTGDDNT